MSVYVLPHSATAKDIKCYAIGGGRIVWTYKERKRSANLAPMKARRSESENKK